MFAPSRSSHRNSIAGRGFRTRSHAPRSRRGITLIEMMVSITLTLIIMGTVMTIFGMITGAVADNRAVMETVDRLKSATSRLQADLQGRTCSTLPWNRIESASGYFLYGEGLSTDAAPNSQNSWLQIPSDDLDLQQLASPENRVLGDCDDVLMLTVRSRGAPFVGRGPNGPLESYLAEVVWFVRPAEVNAQVKPLTLYRRVLLIVSQEQMGGGGGSSRSEFFQRYDISARSQGGRMIPNTLADLTMPENRFSHSGSGNVGSLDIGADSPMRPFPPSSERYGEDVMLTNVVGFDIKAFDPWAGFGGAGDGSVALVPGDFEYSAGGGARGVYVNLDDTASGGDYAGAPREKSMFKQGSGMKAVYDTWSFHYEHDGVSRQGGRDQGTDLLDNDGSGGVDDAGERATSAPYLRPLRGIEISVRVYEADSRQVQQVTIVGDFMP
ncbi:MAG: prepilin-type N-terminal cleavage/methylation domain-containing protein [Pirellulales bacterium]